MFIATELRKSGVTSGGITSLPSVSLGRKSGRWWGRPSVLFEGSCNVCGRGDDLKDYEVGES